VPSCSPRSQQTLLREDSVNARDAFGQLGLVALGACLALACNRSEGEPRPSAKGPPNDSSSAERARSGASSSLDALAPSAAASAGSAPGSARPKKPLNVLFFTVDSLRTDSVPWLGYPRPNAPNLTRLAAQSVVYSNAYAASSYTAKSVATMLSGRFASTLYRDGRFFARYASSNLFLAEILGERGLRSVSWHGHMYFGRKSGFEQGFSEWQLVPGIRFDPETDNDVTSDKMTALGQELLAKKEITAGGFFAWAHYMDPHDQYLKHAEAPDFGKKARDRYDSEIWFTDLWIGKLLDWAKTQPWWSNTAVIVTADHGEAFGEHEMYKHAFELWEVLVRVPLVVYAPGALPRKIDERRSHIDLAPTILELMGVAIPAGFQGRSLVPELYGAAPDVREPILCELAHDSHNPPRRALIQGRLKIIEFERGRYELYDLADDPNETNDLVKSRPSDFAAMKRLLEERFGALPSIAPYGGTKLREGGRANGPEGPADAKR
jgi:arylsulfatase A-like enzyme